MNKITHIILFTCLSAVYLQAADKEPAQVKSSATALVPSAPDAVTPYHDRYFEAFKMVVAGSQFRVSKEEWKRIRDLDYTKTNCANSSLGCCRVFTNQLSLNKSIPLSKHSINFNKLYQESINLERQYALLEPLLFETHQEHICISVNVGLSTSGTGLFHDFTVEKYSDTTTCWWRIYQSYIKAYSLAEWLCIDTPCNTDDKQYIADIQEYGSGKKLTKQSMLNFIISQATTLLDCIDRDSTLSEKYFNTMKITAKAYKVDPNFYKTMDTILSGGAPVTQQTTPTISSLAAELVKQSAPQHNILDMATDSTAKRASKRTRDNDDSTNTDTPPSKRHKPESTDPAPSLAAQPAGVL